MKRLLHFIKSDLSQTEKSGFLILLFGHLLAAYHSFGFHHLDEHFQIFEFAHSYLGLSDPAHLPWEYAAQIRPWFQPFLHALVMKAALLTDTYNAFKIAFFCRIVYALLNIWVMFALWRSFKSRFGLAEIWWPVISALWFLPYIHVRTSSENLSGIFLGFAFLQLWKTQPHFFQGGLLFGFAFLARAQIALGLVGLAVVLLIQSRRVTLDHFKMGLGFAIPVALGVVLDFIGYGNWVLTEYRYFTVNLVQGVAATFNPYPWYQYFIWIAQLNPFVSLPLFGGWLAYIRKHKLDILSGFTLVFFFLHLFITNKEYRFFFPILNFVPFMMAVAFARLSWMLHLKRFWVPYAAISFLAFSVSALRGASIHMLWPSETYAHYSEPGDHWISNRDFKSFFQAAYYELKDVDLTVVHTNEDLIQELRRGGLKKVIIDGKLEDQVTRDLLAVVDGACKLKAQSYPSWLLMFREEIPILKRLVFKAYYECQMGDGA